MPSSPGYVRNYAQERKTAIKRGETGCGSKSGDNKRHKARRKVEKRLGRKLSPNEHVDHKRPVKSGGGNGDGNLRVRSASSNMAHGGRSGNKAGKSQGGKKGAGKRLPVRKP